MGLFSRPLDPSTPCLPAEVWVKHILPACPRWWFREEDTIPSPPAAQRRCVTSDCVEQSDSEGGSTCAPSSSAPSSNATPQSARPRRPPLELENSLDGDASLGGESLGEPSAPLRRHTVASGRELVEVFGNGQRHTIGAGGDPDDMEADEAPQRLAVPLRVLQLLASDTRMLRRRPWQEMEPDEDTEEEDAHDEDLEEESYAMDMERDQDGAEWEAGVDRDADMADMPEVPAMPEIADMADGEEEEFEVDVDEDVDISDAAI